MAWLMDWVDRQGFPPGVRNYLHRVINPPRMKGEIDGRTFTKLMEAEKRDIKIRGWGFVVPFLCWGVWLFLPDGNAANFLLFLAALGLVLPIVNMGKFGVIPVVLCGGICVGWTSLLIASAAFLGVLANQTPLPKAIFTHIPPTNELFALACVAFLFGAIMAGLFGEIYLRQVYPELRK